MYLIQLVYAFIIVIIIYNIFKNIIKLTIFFLIYCTFKYKASNIH